MTTRPAPDRGTTPQPPPSVPPVPEEMLAVVARRYGAAEALKMETVSTPTPGKGEVLVRVEGPKTNRVLGPIPHLGRLAIRFARASQSFHHVNTTANDDDLTLLGDLLATGRITPQIQRTIGLDDIPAGIAEIGTGHARAKIVAIPT